MTILSELLSREVPAANWSPELNRDADVRRVEGTTAVGDNSGSEIEVVEATISVEVSSEGAEREEDGISAEEVVSETEDDEVPAVKDCSEVGNEVPAVEVDPDTETVIGG